jgi:hypothetical protein
VSDAFYGLGYVPHFNESGPNPLLDVGEAIFPGFAQRSPADRKALILGTDDPDKIMAVAAAGTLRPLYWQTISALVNPTAPKLVVNSSAWRDFISTWALTRSFGLGPIDLLCQDSKEEGNSTFNTIFRDLGIAAVAAAFVVAGVVLAGPALGAVGTAAGHAASAAGAAVVAAGSAAVTAKLAGALKPGESPPAPAPLNAPPPPAVSMTTWYIVGAIALVGVVVVLGNR